MADAKWSLDVGAWCSGAMVATELVARKTVGEIFRRVILRTPVDTGRARGNWQATTGTPSALTLDGTDAGRSASLRALEVARGWKIGSASIFLTNNLPYIGVLENGRVGNKGSWQAPQGMVAITVAEFGGIAEDAAAEAKARGVAAYASEWNIGEAGE